MSSYILYAIVIALAVAAGGIHRRFLISDRRDRHIPWLTLFIFLLVAIPTFLQFAFPHLLSLLERNASLVFAGEWWRVITSLAVQDGGVVGAVFNLLSLAVLGIMTEQNYGRRVEAVLFFGTGILTEFVAVLWQPIGAGNSIANFGLAAGILTLALLCSKAILLRVLWITGIVAGLILLSAHDIHGAALCIGTLISFMVLLLQKKMRIGIITL